MSNTRPSDASARLKLLRKRLKKSQKWMAGALQISEPGYQNYETGKRGLPLATVDRAREHLGVNPRWLLDGIGEMFLPATDAPGPEAERIRRTLGLDVPMEANERVPELPPLDRLERATAMVDELLAAHGFIGTRAVLLREALRNVASLDGATPALLELLLRGVEEWERHELKGV